MASIQNPTTLLGGSAKIGGDLDVAGDIDITGTITDDLNIADDVSLTYPENAGPQTLVDIPVDSPEGNVHSYSLRIGGGTLLELTAESDGQGSIKNQTANIPGILNVTTIKLEDTSNSVLDLNGNNIESSGTTIWDSLNNYIPQERLENDSITLNTGNGLKNGSTASLGSTFSIDVEPSDFTGETLNVNNDVVEVNIAKGIVKAESGALTFDEDETYDFAGDISFGSSVSIQEFQDIEPKQNEPAAPSTASVARLFVEDTDPPTLKIKDSTGNKTTIVTLGG
jgi:hypothetical protein